MQARSELSIGESNTTAAHREAVERVILEMRERLAEPHSLDEMARIACLSPFHFDRVFHEITGIPAVQFLYALRIEAAKRLLLTTSLSVTDVCYEVGYGSLGTFTWRFTQLVGLSPRRLRQLAAGLAVSSMDTVLEKAATMFKSSESSKIGVVSSKTFLAGPIFVGLFRTQIPQGKPAGGTLLTEPGSYGTKWLPDGYYYVFAAAFAWSKDPLTYLFPHRESLLVGTGTKQAIARNGRVCSEVDVVLRPVELVDPPILVALPFLLTNL